jgi:hypothetical protein
VYAVKRGENIRAKDLFILVPILTFNVANVFPCDAAPCFMREILRGPVAPSGVKHPQFFDFHAVFFWLCVFHFLSLFVGDYFLTALSHASAKTTARTIKKRAEL